MTVIAIMAVDPGTVSGCARGIFESNDSVWSGLAAGEWETWDCEGSPAVQSWELMGEFLDWRNENDKANGSPVTAYLVMEDFVVRLGQGAASRRELLDPVRVAAGCEALCWTRRGHRWATIEYQQPSEKSFATNARLREHGLWQRGSSDHRRDALRHLILRYSKALRK